MSDQKLLIDTNVLIGLEDNQEIHAPFSELIRKCQKYNIKIFLHEASKHDINRDKDKKRRDIMASKISKFLILEDMPILSRQEASELYGKIKKENDYIDCILLHTLRQDTVDFLITQDIGLHKRANRVGLSDRLFRVEDALVWIRDEFDKVPVSLPFVEEKQCHQINRKEAIFTSLKSDYSGFDNWFVKSCVKKQRHCWIINFHDQLAGIAIRKDEDLSDVIKAIPLSKGKISSKIKRVLKICTFKIDDKFRGEKLGELLLKQILWWAFKNDYELIYLTTFPKQEFLIDLLSQFGFEIIGSENGELYLIKSFSPEITKHEEAPITPLGFHKKYYPKFKVDCNSNIYIVPIKGNYYSRLFPENVKKIQYGLFENDIISGSSYAENQKPGNAIRKVYVCLAQIKNINPGDILLFYHTKDNNSSLSQSIATIGVVESFTIAQSAESLIKLTTKRSVYNRLELAQLTNGDTKEVKVLNFFLAGHLRRIIEFNKFGDLGILGAIQSIRSITRESFQSIESEMEQDVQTA